MVVRREGFEILSGAAAPSVLHWRCWRGIQEFIALDAAACFVAAIFAIETLLIYLVVTE